MKDLIISIIENICAKHGIDMPTQINIDIFNIEEYCDQVDCVSDQAFDIWGEFEYCLMFSDHPDYGFIQKNMNPDQIEARILSWLKEINLIDESFN